MGKAWIMLDVPRESRSATLIMAWLLFGNCHVGALVHCGTHMNGWSALGVGMTSLVLVLFGHVWGCSRRDLSFQGESTHTMSMWRYIASSC